ncbi:monovalent cation/H+ antiporter subunit D [Xanthomonadaceae bacterium XH05]|nr:monovalent cation/H+ antiporter subunit D [Xanthomonadaceae bacterium XH05]
MSAHLPILPIALPMLIGALQLLLERRGIVLQRTLAWIGLAGLLCLSIALLGLADGDTVVAYLVGDWPARLGITLVVDRLSAWMVLTTTLLATACLLHAGSGWDRRAPHFHALLQFLLMGLNGAYLTGDLFNLFVFFEILLAASYGLLLSGGRGGRMRVGFHYLIFNITASTLFLIALGLIYGLLGTLNMAELAVRVSDVAPQDRALVQSVAGLLLVVFCAKGAILPLYLWLPATYGRAQPAVSALFVIMTKVGLYSVLRVYTLLFGETAGELSGFAWTWLLPAGIATSLMAALGTLAAVRLRILAGYLVLVSAGTLFVAFALARADSIGAGLYYLAHSTFTGAALFLIVELVRQRRITDRMNVVLPMARQAVPGTLYILTAIAAIGLPPLSGFIGKFTLLAAVPEERIGWVWSTILLSSFFVMVAMARAGSKLFWIQPPPGSPSPGSSIKPRMGHRSELAAIILLLAYCVAMTVAAGPALRYTMATGEQLVDPGNYIQAVRDKTPALRDP